MKFSVFADFHYYPEVWWKGTVADLEFIQQRAEKENVDFIIHVGDFTHGPSKTPEIVKLYNEFHVPSYHCLGNHDTDNTSFEETVQLYNMPGGYYFFDNGGYRFIVCDPNYILLDGEYIHYSLGNYYKHPEARGHMPPEQIKWLEETIAASPYPCVLFSHQSLERDVLLTGSGVVQELEEVRRIINEANRRKPHSVIMCINGHLHRDFIRILDNVCYFDLNSTSWDYVAKEHNLYPEELVKEHSLVNSTVIYNDPIHAVITLEGTTITIDGMESSMFMGINREHTENEQWDMAGRPVVPKVQSAKFTLH